MSCKAQPVFYPEYLYGCRLFISPLLESPQQSRIEAQGCKACHEGTIQVLSLRMQTCKAVPRGCWCIFKSRDLLSHAMISGASPAPATFALSCFGIVLKGQRVHNVTWLLIELANARTINRAPSRNGLERVQVSTGSAGNKSRSALR